MAIVSVDLNGKNCLSYYGLYLKHRVIGFPEAKTDYIDLPGADGSLDFTGAGTGAVKYRNRTIRLTFKRLNDGLFWTTAIPALVNDINGKIVYLVFEDDTSHYYKGRAFVNAAEGFRLFGEIEVSFDCLPFRYAIDNTVPQEWMGEGLDTNIVYYGAFDVSSSKTVNLINPISTALSPTIYVSANMTATKGGTSYSLTKGTNTPAISLAQGDNEVTFTGSGRVIVDYSSGVTSL